MRHICLFLQVHQPLRFRRYRFFDIGNDHYYYDDYSNETTIRNLAEKSYLPANKLLIKLATQLKGQFKVALSISGITLEQFELYAPEVVKSFQKLVKTGCVEIVSGTWSHSLSSLGDKSIFENQVKLHEQQLLKLFGQKPEIFSNTEMIYSDDIGAMVYKLGYKGILTEGAKHVLGWKSPNFMYVNALKPRLKVLMRNFKLSDDISFRFSNKNWSEYPLTADKFISWINKLDDREEVVNLFMNYESFGERQKKDSGIFNFLEHFIRKGTESKTLKLSSPSEIIHDLQPMSIVNVPNPVSWADEERDLTAWLGNSMQEEAFEKLYKSAQQIINCADEKLIKEWNFMQASDHFYYMKTKLFSDGQIHGYHNPFDSPYKAFINYMNILSDFSVRLKACTEGSEPKTKIASLNKLIEEKDKKIKKMEAELMRLKKYKLKGRTVKKTK